MAAFAEHTKRVWSVDFSNTDPQRFLSGSDDGTVRLWSINEQVNSKYLVYVKRLASKCNSPTCAPVVHQRAGEHQVPFVSAHTFGSLLQLQPSPPVHRCNTPNFFCFWYTFSVKEADTLGS